MAVSPYARRHADWRIEDGIARCQRCYVPRDSVAVSYPCGSGFAMEAQAQVEEHHGRHVTAAVWRARAACTRGRRA